MCDSLYTVLRLLVASNINVMSADKLTSVIMIVETGTAVYKEMHVDSFQEGVPTHC